MYSGTMQPMQPTQPTQPIDYEKKERTAAQLYGAYGELSDYELTNKWEHLYKTYREMISDPTIAFARMLCVAPLVTVGWSYEEKEGAPAGAKELVEESLAPWRIDIVKAAMEGYIDYGWAGYEMIYSVEEGKAYLTKVKPLLQAQTWILVCVKTGEYLGLRQYDYKNQNVDLGIYDSLHIAIDVEGTNWYGRPLLENARAIYTQWNQVNGTANKYDMKVAGASWVVYYPIGESPYKGQEKVDNYDIAQDFLGALQSNGRLAIPMSIAKWQTDMNVSDENAGWKIELISDKGAGSVGFVERQKYLDALKVRAFGMPERAVLEGQYGTKAEASAHADFAITTFEMRHQIIVQQINRQATNFILETNFGKEAIDTVVVKANPLVDERRILLEKIYSQVIGSPDGMMNEMQSLDMQTFRKQLDLPENPLMAGANGMMPAAQGLLSEYFAELQQQGGMPMPSKTPGVNYITGPAVGIVPPEYWQAQEDGISLAFDESKHPRDDQGQWASGGGDLGSHPSVQRAVARLNQPMSHVNTSAQANGAAKVLWDNMGSFERKGFKSADEFAKVVEQKWIDKKAEPPAAEGKSGEHISFHSGEYAGMTGKIESQIPYQAKGQDKNGPTMRIQIDGFPKPGGWNGQVVMLQSQIQKFAHKKKE